MDNKNNMKRLNDKNIILTGGTSGIGEETVYKLVENGANVVFCGRDRTKGNCVKQKAEKSGTIVEYVHCDMTDKIDICRCFDNAVEIFGTIDSAFNNAGIEGDIGKFADSTEENWDNVFDTNFKGVWHCMKHEISHMLGNGKGNILNMASTAGLIGNGFGMTAYSASKHAIIGLSKSVSLEYAKENIRVNAICPGFIETPMVNKMSGKNKKLKGRFIATHPIRRMGTVEEIANAVLYLLSDESSFMTGSSFLIDGGLTV